MRLARVIGTVTLSPKLDELQGGRFLVAEALDGVALAGMNRGTRRAAPMPESLVVYDDLGAGVGQVIAVSEGREAAMPFSPARVPLDAYCAAIIDSVEV